MEEKGCDRDQGKGGVTGSGRGAAGIRNVLKSGSKEHNNIIVSRMEE